jgi:hypothetical protein
MSAYQGFVAYFASFSMWLILLSILEISRSGLQNGSGAVDAFLFSIDETVEQPQKTSERCQRKDIRKETEVNYSVEQ